MNIIFDHYFLIFFICFAINIVTTFVALFSVDRHSIVGMLILAAIPYLNILVALICLFNATKLTLGSMIEAFRD